MNIQECGNAPKWLIFSEFIINTQHIEVIEFADVLADSRIAISFQGGKTQTIKLSKENWTQLQAAFAMGVPRSSGVDK